MVEPTSKSVHYYLYASSGQSEGQRPAQTRKHIHLPARTRACIRGDTQVQSARRYTHVHFHIHTSKGKATALLSSKQRTACYGPILNTACCNIRTLPILRRFSLKLSDKGFNRPALPPPAASALTLNPAHGCTESSGTPGHDPPLRYAAPRDAAGPGPPLTSISGDRPGAALTRPHGAPPRGPSASRPTRRPRGRLERTVRERHREPWLRLPRLCEIKDAISGGRTPAAAHHPHGSTRSRPRARALACSARPSPQGATRAAAFLPHVVCTFPRRVLVFRRNGRESRHTALI